MARIRSLKPNFFTSEQVVSVSIPARMLFQGMWVFGDDDGYIADSILQLKLKIFPLDDVDVENLVLELIEVGLVNRLQTDQGSVLFVPSFAEHQSPRFPTPTKYTVDGVSLTKHYGKASVRLPKGSGNTPDGEERRGEERSNKPPISPKGDSGKNRGTRIDPNWLPSREDVEAVAQQCPGFDTKREHLNFIDYWQSVAGAKGVKLSWSATWRSWMRRAYDRAPAIEKQRRKVKVFNDEVD